MKTTAQAFAIIAALAAGFTSFAEDDHWTYNSGTGTISDGLWTFNATVASDNTITVGTCTNYPASLSTLDFAKPVQDAGGTQYTIKKLDTKMASFSDGDAARPENSTAKAEALKVGELRLPASGLTSIGKGAFCHLDNCTNVVNYLPDSVRSIDYSAFAYCAARRDLFLRGLSGKAVRGIFYKSKIRSITFGPNFKGTDVNGNTLSPFQDCSSITNLVFDPDSSGIVFAEPFRSKPTLTQPLILYGVTNIANAAFQEWTIPSITFADGIANFGTLYLVSGLKEVNFLGAPPTSQSGTWADYGQGTSIVTTYIPSKFLAQWKPYAANGEIKKINTTFSSTYATNPSKRPLYYTGSIRFTISLR